jgi:hypothetical protein
MLAESICRIVEVRACKPDGVYKLDWGNNVGVVTVSGNLIFQGSIVMTGLGWNQLNTEGDSQGPGQLLEVLQPTGRGVVEYEVGSNLNVAYLLVSKPGGACDSFSEWHRSK